MIWSLVLAMVPGRVGLHVADTEGVSLESARELVGELGQQLQARGATVAIDSMVWSARCDRRDHCVDAVRARTLSEQVVVLRIFTGVTRTLVIAELFLPDQQPGRFKAGLRVGETHTAALARLADQIRRALLPIPRPAIGNPRPVTRAPAAARAPIVPWVLVAGGAVLVAVGTGLAVSGHGAASDLGAHPLTQQEFDRLSGRATTHRAGGTVLLTAGAAALIGGALWIAFE